MGAFDDLMPQKDKSAGAFADLIPQKSVLDHTVDAAKGAAVGLADLGNSVINAALYLPGKVSPSLAQWNRTRNADMDYITESNKDSVPFQVGRVGGNIAATWPIGGVAGGAVKAVSAAPKMQALGNAIASGGFRTGTQLAADAGIGAKAADMGIRIAGGGIAGGVTTAAVSPDDAGVGAAIGAVLPPVVKGVGKAGEFAARGIKAIRTPQDAQAAKTILDAAEATTPDQISAIRSALSQQGPSLLPSEASLTVPQILQMPGVSQLQRTVKAAGDTTLLHREAAQNAARLQALDGISPVSGTVQQAAENLGNSVQAFARPAERAESQRINQLYESIDPMDATRFEVPVAAMRTARDKFLGPGTFGSGRAAEDAVRTAQELSGDPALQQPLQVSFRELQNLRSSIGEAAQAATDKGRNKEAAALRTMIDQIDNRINGVAAGNYPNEHFPPQMVQAWRDANAAHEAKMARFHAGPQASMFRNGMDGQPSAQGAELAGKFFNSTRSQVEDAQSFNRLVGNNQNLVAALKNYGITDLANQTDRLGNLSPSKFNNWLDARSGAVRETFNDQERATMRKIAEDLIAADKAENLGRSTGSNTVQNAQNALGLGLLDSPLVSVLANKIPLVNSVAAPILGTLKESAKRAKAQAIGGLLSDPVAADTAIRRYLQAQQPTRIGNGLGLLGQVTDPALPLLYHGAPLLGTSR